MRGGIWKSVPFENAVCSDLQMAGGAAKTRRRRLSRAGMPSMAESNDLERFVRAQDAPAGTGTVYEAALAELRAGEKRTHWMWFVLPQLLGLGESAMSKTYGIATLSEAKAY